MWKKSASYFIIIVITFLAFILGYYAKTLINDKGISQTGKQNISSISTTPASLLSPKDEAKSVITEFEELQKARNSDILNLFTPPSSPQEASDYSFLMALDLPSPSSPRLYKTAGFSYRSNEYEIVNIETTKEGFRAVVEEERQDFDNTDGRWSSSHKKTYVLELVKVGINIMIDKYYPLDGKGEKYEGF